MALKFLNKKGWHTGSLRNIENVWKAEQKHDAEQKKLEELRKQIQEERERSEFRLLQEQAGLVPRQERLDFLYESGLAVGKGSSEGFKALEALPKTQPEAASSSTAKPQQASAPGALFEEKPQSANDAWRKLHSDPLLLIRQREQESLARIKNNPIQMAMIRKSVVAKKHKEETPDRKEFSKKLHHRKSKHTSSDSHSDSEGEESKITRKRKRSKYDEHLNKVPNSEELREQHARRKKKSKHSSSDSHSDSRGEERETTNKRKSSKYDEHLNKDPNLDELREQDARRKKYDRDLKYEHRPPRDLSNSEQSVNQHRNNRNYDKSKRDKYYCEEDRVDSESARKGREGRTDRNFSQGSRLDSADLAQRHESHRHRNAISKLTHEERAARLREMQMDAELHEEQRWRRIKKAEHDDVVEANRAHMAKGRNFLDAARKSVFGAEKGGSSTIEESVRRRTHYLQGRSDVEGNAFRR